MKSILLLSNLSCNNYLLYFCYIFEEIYIFYLMVHYIIIKAYVIDEYKPPKVSFLIIFSFYNLYVDKIANIFI